MDMWYQKYSERIGKLNLKYNLLYKRNRWVEAYNAFNGKFFDAYTTDEKVEVTNKMDALEQYIHNDLVRLRLSFRECARELPEDAIDVVTDFQLCDVFNQIAQKIWEYEFGFRHPGLDKIKTLGWRWLYEYFNWNVDVSMNTDEAETNVNIICRKIIKWTMENKDN